MFEKYLFVILSTITIINAADDKKQNAVLTTVSPMKTESQTPTINDADYFDNDDFVPYRNNRHDEFDWKLTKTILKKEQSNVIVSPFSVKLLLSLLGEAAGSDTSTHRELSSVLPSIQSAIQARELYGKIFGSLMQKSKNYDLKLGTKMYVDEFIQPRQRFAAIIESYYFTQVEKIDFKRGDVAADLINSWCRNITEDQIKQLVTKDDVEMSVIILLNAIYFNGYWRRPFPENETMEMPFFKSPTSQVKTKFMRQTANYYYLQSQALNANILRLPYKGRKFAMTIILPNAKGGLNEMIDQLESNSLQRAQWLMDEVEVRVALPKFKFKTSTLMNDVLQELGIRQIFTKEASFPMMARGNDVKDRLQVSKVLQKAGIDVNERGSTAYAATEITLTNKFGGDTVREFIADRPFMFLIEDEPTGTLLFAGKVTNPDDFVI